MNNFVSRAKTEEIRELLTLFPVVAILGARQVGKTTLAKELCKTIPGDSVYLDLENREDLNKLNEPELYLKRNKDKIIILDEIQLKPDLFTVLRGIIDQDRRAGRFIVLGSAGRDLLKQSSETLAGRIGYIDLTPFTVNEVKDMNRLWLRGGFPLSYLAHSDNGSYIWRKNFIRTFLQRDIPMLGISIAPLQLEQFWVMLAHSHGKCFNASTIAQNFGISVPTVKRYLSIFEETYMVRQLYPYSLNIKKRLVKTPKVYIRDSGILHSLLNIKSEEALSGNPVIGASYEGWVIEQICSSIDTNDVKAYFYRTHSGAEIDLVLEDNNGLTALEIKRSLAPKVSRGFHETIQMLNIKNNFIIYPGIEIYNINKDIVAMPLDSFIKQNL